MTAKIIPKCYTHNLYMEQKAYFDSKTQTVGVAFFCMSCMLPPNLKLYKRIKEAIEEND